MSSINVKKAETNLKVEAQSRQIFKIAKQRFCSVNLTQKAKSF